MAKAELNTSLAKFVAFARSLRGDEKGEAQSFLDHFFRALGHEGVVEAGALFEFRVAKKPGSAQLELIKGEDCRASVPDARRGTVSQKRPTAAGKKFADLLWPGRVLLVAVVAEDIGLFVERRDRHPAPRQSRENSGISHNSLP